MGSRFLSPPLLCPRCMREMEIVEATAEARILRCSTLRHRFAVTREGQRLVVLMRGELRFREQLGVHGFQELPAELTPVEEGPQRLPRPLAMDASPRPEA